MLRRLLIAAGAVVVLLIVAFGPMVIAQFTKVKPKPALQTAEDRSFPVLATASGVLQPGNLENVNFTISGQVATIGVTVNEKVAAGQPLANLNDGSQQAELDAANSSVSAAEAAIAQAQASGSKAQVAQAEAQLAQARVGLIKAKADEAATVLRSPEAGTVLAINGIAGDTVSAGNSGFANPATNGGSAIANGFIVIGDSTSFDFWAPFSQTEDVEIQHGQPAVVSVDAIPGLSLKASVSTIESSATQVGGVPEYYAEITLSQSDPRLRNGQTGSVSVTIANATNVLAVPSTALFTGANNATQVDVWSGGQAYATTVTTGLTGNTLTQIISGLQAGEQVVLSPSGQTGLPSTPAPSPT
ncbi:MAG TPA: efflux RND transporter periplasmic adaptor subunit [Candidatus Dormibacteraeota bacterium]